MAMFRNFNRVQSLKWKKLLVYSILLAITIMTISCSEKEIGNSVSFQGYVILTDENGVSVDDMYGVNVSVQGTNNHTVTDVNGKFSIEGLKALTSYQILFTKEGFANQTYVTRKYVGEQKPAIINGVYVYQYPTASLVNSSIELQANSIKVRGEVSPDKKVAIFAYANDSVNVSEKHYDIYSSEIPDYFDTSSSPFVLTLTIPNNKYAAGTIIYVAVYFYNPQDYSIDQKTSGKKVGTLQITL